MANIKLTILKYHQKKHRHGNYQPNYVFNSRMISKEFYPNALFKFLQLMKQQDFPNTKNIYQPINFDGYNAFSIYDFIETLTKFDNENNKNIQYLKRIGNSFGHHKFKHRCWDFTRINFTMIPIAISLIVKEIQDQKIDNNQIWRPVKDYRDFRIQYYKDEKGKETYVQFVKKETVPGVTISN